MDNLNENSKSNEQTSSKIVCETIDDPNDCINYGCEYKEFTAECNDVNKQDLLCKKSLFNPIHISDNIEVKIIDSFKDSEDYKNNYLLDNKEPSYLKIVKPDSYLIDYFKNYDPNYNYEPKSNNLVLGVNIINLFGEGYNMVVYDNKVHILIVHEFDTYIFYNITLIELDNIKILIDPWLNGELTFPPGDWLIKGVLAKAVEAPKNINFLLLTQGQPDHAHPETLNKIKKTVPVLASEAASKIVKGLGFNNVNTLKPGDTFTYNNLKILATSGASVPNLENGYIIDHNLDSIYIEPHGFLDKEIKSRNIDLVITPVIDFALPIAGKFIKGKTVLPELIKLFSPSTILASTTGGDIKFSGLINSLINVEGSLDDIKILEGTKTNFINPKPLKQYVFEKD